MKLDRRNALLGLSATAVAMAIRPANAQTQPASGMGLDAYVQQTLVLGAGSLMASQLAAKMATDENVVQFANLEIAEQETIAGVLASTASGKSPPQISPQQQQELDRLAAVRPGRDFDLSYVEAQIMGHNELLEIQRTASGNREASVEAVVARLAEQAVASHIVMLGLIQQMLASEDIQNMQKGKNPDGTTTPIGCSARETEGETPVAPVTKP